MRSSICATVLVLSGALMACGGASAAEPVATGDAGQVRGSAAPITIWVNPSKGKDRASGKSRKTALKTLTAAWNRIPQGKQLARGYRIRITKGTLKPSGVPNYWEQRYGSLRAPITIESADGRGAAKLPAVNLFDVRGVSFVGIRFDSKLGDVVHCEQCDRFTLKGVVVRGAPRASGQVQETVKINQTTNLVIADSDISGASDNALDLVAVQYARIERNKIHDATDWCAYAKGGSAYVRVEGNEFSDCGTGGFTAGQGTGAQFMTPPFTQYEAYHVRIVNNVARDIEGAAFGVNGGFKVLLAHNTAYRTGSRDHLLEFVSGHRSCDGRPGDDGRERCAQYVAGGGWATSRVDDGENYVRIPNKHVYVYDNLLVNPPGVRSEYTHFVVGRAYDGEWQAGSGVPTPTLFDDDLRIVGNVIWNGPADLAIGMGGDEFGCGTDNAGCNEDQARRDNAINTVQPQLSKALRLTSTSGLPAAAAIPEFPAGGPSLGIPVFAMGTNAVPKDRAGTPRAAGGRVGAYAS